MLLALLGVFILVSLVALACSALDDDGSDDVDFVGLPIALLASKIGSPVYVLNVTNFADTCTGRERTVSVYDSSRMPV